MCPAVRLYADEYPRQVAGVVFVDASAPQWQTAFTPKQWQILKAITGPSKEQLAKYPAMERLNFDASVAQARAAAPLCCSLPVVVVSRDTRTPPGDLGPVIASAVAQHKLPAFVPKNFGYIDDRAWDKAQDALATLVPGARHIIVTGDHNIQIDHPRAVADAIRQVLGTARQQQGRISRPKPYATQTGRPNTAAGPRAIRR